ncbi:hypothetical protein GGR57DRAFT_498220 [Xylariaceae sp. FL1272]|nr:hypothetical protein GGR57DRAFT_498220 [Xylariaceae sp. FL1272]
MDSIGPSQGPNPPTFPDEPRAGKFAQYEVLESDWKKIKSGVLQDGPLGERQLVVFSNILEGGSRMNDWPTRSWQPPPKEQSYYVTVRWTARILARNDDEWATVKKNIEQFGCIVSITSLSNHEEERYDVPLADPCITGGPKFGGQYLTFTSIPNDKDFFKKSLTGPKRADLCAIQFNFKVEPAHTRKETTDNLESGSTLPKVLILDEWLAYKQRKDTEAERQGVINPRTGLPADTLIVRGTNQGENVFRLFYFDKSSIGGKDGAKELTIQEIMEESTAHLEWKVDDNTDWKLLYRGIELCNPIKNHGIASGIYVVVEMERRGGSSS